MPVTITLADHRASSTPVTELTHGTDDNPKTVCSKESQEFGDILRSSFADANLKDPNVLASANGFVHAALEAYNKQRHLNIRPEDVWFAILSQLGIWIHSDDEAGAKLTNHDGKKDLTIIVSSRGGFETVADEICEMRKKFTDPELAEWIIPEFSTTRATDAVVASILTLGTVHSHISCYPCREGGIPSITLLGEQSDWEKLFKKLDKLATFDTEPTTFKILLKPVILRFIESFQDPTNQYVTEFWAHMVGAKLQDSGDSGFVGYEGWISAFCFLSQLEKDMHDTHYQLRAGNCFTLDAVPYHNLDYRQIPHGYASLPVKFDDSGNQYDALMVAGSKSVQYTTKDGPNAGSDTGRDSENTVSGSGWWMLVKQDGVEETADASEDDVIACTNSTADPESIALPEDGPVTATNAQQQSLMTRLANLFSWTAISE